MRAKRSDPLVNAKKKRIRKNPETEGAGDGDVRKKKARPLAGRSVDVSRRKQKEKPNVDREYFRGMRSSGRRAAAHNAEQKN